MASASGTSGELDGSVPQWKKDLILRKRSQSTGNKNSQQMFLLSSRCNNSSPNASAGSSFIVGTGGGGAESPSEHLAVEGELQPAQTTAATVGRKVLNGKDCFDARLRCNVQVANNDSITTSVVNCVSLIEKEVKMVQDSVIIMRAPIATNGDCCKNGNGSDTSEELQYGPGIVSKLKSKYLSLTLRQANAKSRPSILPMRRATSLENLLDADSADEALAGDHNLNGRHSAVPNSGPRRYAPSKNIPTSRYRPATRGECQKRARSVETLVRSQSQPADLTQAISGNESTNRKPGFDNKPSTVDGNSKPSANNCNGTQKINRPKRIAPIMDETERPPTDHVKQTLMLFEGPAVRRTKAPRSTGDVAAKVANFKNIIDQEKPISGSILNNNPKKALGPKPHITSPKPTLSKRSSPVKRPLTPITSLDKDPLKNRPITRVVSPVEIITPPLSPQAKPSPIPDISRGTDPDSETIHPHTLSETPDLIVHSTPAKMFSPNTVKNITSVFLKEESKTVEVKSDNKVSKTPFSRSPSPKIASPEMVVDGFNKEITKQSMENISKAGLSITYRFNDNVSKSHLPRLNTIPIRINRLVPDTPSKIPPVKMSNGSSEPSPPIPSAHSQIKKSSPKTPQSPILTPTITSNPDPSPILIPTPAPSIIAATNKNVSNSNKPRPPPPVQNQNQNQNSAGKNLTSREIEKNSINKLKTLEQPVSKVVVSMRSVDEVVANKNASGKGKPRSDQTTILFNFQTRDTVPDYIPTDGSASTRRGKREKPKVN